MRLLSALQSAALRGVEVQVLMPRRSNWPIVQWALAHNLVELVKVGVVIWQLPPPMSHAKCVLVDDRYALLGSANMDPRSLRLNFELGIDLFDAQLCQYLKLHFERKFAGSAPLKLEHLASRNLAVRLRDSIAALFSPYL